MDAELVTNRYCPFPRQPMKPNEPLEKDTRLTPGSGMKPGYTGYIPGNLHFKIHITLVYFRFEVHFFKDLWTSFL